MSAHVALALLALGTPATGSMPRARDAQEEARARQARPEPRPHRDVTTAIAALAEQFRETSAASSRSR